ncbi:FAD:protein FMN transferase [Chlamydiales bacterium SCGC AG-110-P3]|nr:FAD:protein FMN transferase [Chlamydiales bacterium SCGC AG-110-P3]
MARYAVISVVLAVALFAVACSPNDTTVTFSDIRMCIRYKVVVGEALSFDKTEAVRQVIDRVFSEVDTVYNQWNPDSEVTRINHSDAHIPIPISDSLKTFLAVVDCGIALSYGHFDPTVEPLVATWKQALEQGTIPGTDAISVAKEAVGWHRLSCSTKGVIKETADLQLNFDGVAKGYAVDRILDELLALEIENLYVEWGGEIRVAGRHPERRPWRVMVTGIDGIKGTEEIEVIDLVDEAIATSGDYYQQWQITNNSETITYTHIVDPTSGEALQVRSGGVASATVIAPTCALADLLATTCMLFTSGEEARKWAYEVENQVPGTRFWIVTRGEL